MTGSDRDPLEEHLRTMEAAIRTVAAEDDLIDRELQEYREKCMKQNVAEPEIRRRLARLQAAALQVTKK